MSNSLSYKGFTAQVEFSSEDECFVGHILGIRDIVGFHAEDTSKLKIAFEEAVDDYLDTCNHVSKFSQSEQVVS
jgi:predicted HicB family RNase H-like nuclease